MSEQLQYPVDEQDVERRAWSAYYRVSPDMEAPSKAESGLVEVDGRPYYIFRDDVGGFLVAFRVLKDGALRRIRRWPKKWEEMVNE